GFRPDAAQVALRRRLWLREPDLHRPKWNLGDGPAQRQVLIERDLGRELGLQLERAGRGDRDVEGGHARGIAFGGDADGLAAGERGARRSRGPIEAVFDLEAQRVGAKTGDLDAAGAQPPLRGVAPTDALLCDLDVTRTVLVKEAPWVVGQHGRFESRLREIVH